VWALAAPRALDPRTGKPVQSVLKPLGRPAHIRTFTGRGEGPEDAAARRRVHLPPGNPEEAVATQYVMGGRIVEQWIDALLAADLLAPGFTLVTISYRGNPLNAPVYRDGLIGLAKADLEFHTRALHELLQGPHRRPGPRRRGARRRHRGLRRDPGRALLSRQPARPSWASASRTRSPRCSACSRTKLPLGTGSRGVPSAGADRAARAEPGHGAPDPRRGDPRPLERRLDHVDDDRVSRRHTRILVVGPEEVRLEDLGSKNGTWVNGRRVATAELHNGDTIQIGNDTVFQFSYRDPVEQRLLERQKMEAIGRLAGGVAHEFNNLLAVVLGNLSQLQRHMQSGEGAAEVQLDMLRDAISATTRATEMTHQLLGIARRARVSDTPVNVSALVEDLGRLVSRTLVRDIELKLEIEPRLHIRGQAPELQQALLNLCINARDAMTRGRHLDPARAPPATTTRPRRPCRASFVEIRVEDTGVGHGRGDAEARVRALLHHQDRARHRPRHVDRPRHRHRARRAHRRPEPAGPRHHGHRRAAVRRGASRPPRPADRARPRPPAEPHVLLVEDEDALRRSVTRMLQHLGTGCSVAADGVEAVDLFRRHIAEVDVVLLDVSMPRQSGAQTFEALRAISPTVKVLLSSGYHGDHLEPALRASVDGFLPKPYSLQQLVDALKTVA
jgi:CheY-like chemotaxis protein